MDKPLQKPKILATESVAKSRLFNIEQVHLAFSNGERRIYERMRGNNSGAVMIVPVLAGQTWLLAREYAVGTEKYELGFPKGLIDPGETPVQAANRELQEELGFGAKQLIPLKTLAMAPGFFGSQMHIFLALDLYPSKLPGDEPEPIECVHFAIADTAKLLADSDFNEARSVAALFLAKQELDRS
ncbi:ADP compounds hydrolase NudE [Paraferrimonas sp. SM1919]|uniref:ADP compounds hydrolase NudE n=1 Tax=Paraferrimonas sp. SM1919 TaxID=2662263 RepID=UPI0013CF6108|nr:ADP compounds hydrolase NudE [Paraferrimonas sp. SM1919]